MAKFNNNLMYSIIVPCYNSEIFIEDLINKVDKVFMKNYELILVDDKSTDNTLKKIIKLKNENLHLRIISLNENIGQLGATLIGLKVAVGKYSLTIDDDLQHNISEYTILKSTLESKNSEIVIATWKTDETLIRNVSSYFFNFISSIAILKKSNFRNTAFRLVKSIHNDQIFYFFINKFWFDPRRIFKDFEISQVRVNHFIQYKRPQSSFKSRVKLASKHIFLDTNLLSLAFLLLSYFKLYFLYLLLFNLIIQNLTRSFFKNKRIKVFLNLKEF